MSTSTTEPTHDRRAADYLDAVRSHLADLPTEERDDLLEDLEAHVHEVAAATEGPLEDALGPPAAFAAELRASAGLAPTVARAPAALDRLRRRTDAIHRHPWTRAAIGFLPELRPAWWVARGWLLVWLVAEATGSDESSFPFPELFNNEVLGLAAAVLAVVWSVRLGRSPAPPRWRWAVNAAAVVGALLFLDATGEDDAPVRYVAVETPGSPVSPDGDPVLLWHADGTQITDLDAYGPDGQVTHDVVIVDQNGHPIDLGRDSGPPLPPDLRPGAGQATTTTSTTTTTTTAPAPTTVPGS
jgi:hypothetical protein